MTVTYQKQLQTLVKGYALLPLGERRSLESTTGASPSVTIRFERTQTPLHGVKQATATGFSDQNQSRLVTWSNRDGSTRFPRQIGAALRSLGRHLKGKQRTLAFFRALIRLKGVCMLDVTGPTVGYTDVKCLAPGAAATTTTTTVTTVTGAVMRINTVAPAAAPTTAAKRPRRRSVESTAAFRIQHAFQRYCTRRPPSDDDVPDAWDDE